MFIIALYPTDNLSRNGTAYKNIPESEKEEAEDLIFVLHMTPYADAIRFHVIAAETEKDEKMKLLAQIIRNELAIKEKLRLMKSELADFKKLLPELSLNGIILKGGRIVLPETLQARALNLAD